jgi:hypothetical protein
VILTNAASVNEDDRIDVDPAGISEVLENATVSGGCVVVMRDGDRFLVKEDFETVERMRHDSIN